MRDVMVYLLIGCVFLIGLAVGIVIGAFLAAY